MCVCVCACACACACACVCMCVFCLLAEKGGRYGDGFQIPRSNSDPPFASAAGAVPYGGERLSIAPWEAQSAGHRPYTLEHGYVRPCAELFDAPPVSFFCRPRGTHLHFRPTFHRRRRLIVIVALLLRSGIESNPGPSSHKRMQLNLGLINAQSFVVKAARVYDITEDNHLGGQTARRSS